MDQFCHQEEDRQIKIDINFFYDDRNKKGFILFLREKEIIFRQFSSNWCHNNPCMYIGYGHHSSNLHWLKINF